MIKAGLYTARIADYGIVFAQSSGEPRAMIKFSFKDAEGGQHAIMWGGSFKEGTARDITIATLLTCGLRNDDIESLADGPSSGMLDMNADISIKVELEPDQSGRERPVIKYVGEMGFRNQATKGDVAQKFAGMNLKGDLAAARAKLNKPAVQNFAPQQGQQQQAAPSKEHLDKVPF